MNRDSFTVDAALLQELGERLIGRAHVALSELIKNSYDADAIDCQIEFKDDCITITDNGHGMSESEFLEHWMRIGTTHKVDKKYSKSLNRSMTGSKGIGRLSAQFLASDMILESTSVDTAEEMLYAIIDWGSVQRGQSLDAFEVLWEPRKKEQAYANGSSTGTRITLNGLKNEWDAGALQALGREVWMLRSPFESDRREPLKHGAYEFYIDVDAPGIEDAREAFDEMRRNLFGNWRARISGSVSNGRRYGTASISIAFKAGYPEGVEEGNEFNESISLPVGLAQAGKKSLVDYMKFDILIFKPLGRQLGGIAVGDMREYLSKFGNISIYDAGFRLPYYGSGEEKTGQDWLNIALDQGRRLGASELLPERFRTQTGYMEDLPAPGRLFGSVEINTNHERVVATEEMSSPGGWLQIQSSRDRLNDNLAFFQLRDLVRYSLDLYANRHRTLRLQAIDQNRDRVPASRKFDQTLEVLEQGKSRIPTTMYRELKRGLTDARKTSAKQEKSLDQRAAILATLATAGMTALAWSHELARESRLLGGAGEKLSKIAKAHSLPELRETATEFEELRARFEAMQELFLPLLSETDVAATERLRVRPLVTQVVRSMQPLLPNVEFEMHAVSASLCFPIGSFAEWSAILQNVMANSWNAMLDSKEARISFDAGRSRGGDEWLRISDTGQGLGMSLKESQDMFEPFERRLQVSRDNRSIMIGGQGLGLAIVRMIARRRRATARFIESKTNFSTTIEIAWKGARR